jgi:hypothetical protein
MLRGSLGRARRVSTVSARFVETRPTTVNPEGGRCAQKACLSRHVASRPAGWLTRQAGGHWFEPSTAHLSKAPLGRVLFTGEAATGLATCSLSALGERGSRGHRTLPSSILARRSSRCIAFRTPPSRLGHSTTEMRVRRVAASSPVLVLAVRSIDNPADRGLRSRQQRGRGRPAVESPH